jgi:hypothetical protein
MTNTMVAAWRIGQAAGRRWRSLAPSRKRTGICAKTSPSAPTKVQNNTASRITEPHEGVDR